jgi:biopolymer transport protein ExbD
MNKFRKKKKGTPEIPTAALPDIIFILLFFFIVTSNPKDEDQLVENVPVQITEVSEIDDPHLVVTILIGTPVDQSTYGSSPRVQINDKFVALEQIQKVMKEEKQKLGNNGEKMLIVLKVNSETDYGIVSDVKEKLREIDMRLVNFNGVKTKSL